MAGTSETRWPFISSGRMDRLQKEGERMRRGWEARPLGVQEETKLSLRVFRGKVNLPGRGVHPHGRRHELANQGFHVRQDFFLFRQRAFGVHHVDGAVRHGFNDLADDAQGLAHFFNAHGKTVVAVSVFAYGDVEFVIFISQIGGEFAQVPLNAAGSQVGPRNTPGKRFFTADDAYALKTVNEDFVFEQEGFRFIKGFGRFIAEDEHFLEHFIGNITRLSADAGIGGSEARPSELFVKIMDFFTFLITVQENGHGAYVHAVHAYAQDVGGKAGKFQGQYAQGLSAGRQFPSQQFFHRAGIGDVVGQGAR